MPILSLFHYFIQIYTSFGENYHLELLQWSESFIELLQDDRDSLRTIPIPCFPAHLETFFYYVVNRKWAKLPFLIVHEKSQYIVVLLLYWAIQIQVKVSEITAQQMSHHSLTQHHLPCSHHATPSTITLAPTLRQWLLKTVPVRDPHNRLEYVHYLLVK